MRQGRRGSTAIEFAVALPLMLIVLSGIIDLGRQLTYADQLATVVSESARAGALANPAKGEDPVYVAEDTAEVAWRAMQMGASLDIVATVEGAWPDKQIRVVGTTDPGLLFGFIHLPTTTHYEQVVRLDRQTP